MSEEQDRPQRALQPMVIRDRITLYLLQQFSTDIDDQERIVLTSEEQERLNAIDQKLETENRLNGVCKDLLIEIPGISDDEAQTLFIDNEIVADEEELSTAMTELNRARNMAMLRSIKPMEIHNPTTLALLAQLRDSNQD